MSFESVAGLFDYSALPDFLAALGAGDITGAHISNRVLDELRRQRNEIDEANNVIKLRTFTLPAVEDRSNGVKILGTGGLLTNIASCCNPMPGDPITGYVTRGRGVTIHRSDCSNVLSVKDVERLIDVSWGGVQDAQRYVVPVEVVSYDREALIRDITTVARRSGRRGSGDNCRGRRSSRRGAAAAWSKSCRSACRWQASA
jgi:GTP pyrophosphokinase